MDAKPKINIYLEERYSFEGSSQLYDELVSSRARGSGFIVPSSEREPLDQTDIDWTVILDPLGRWRLVPKESPDPTLQGAGAQVNWAGAQCLAPFGLCFHPMASRVL